MDNNRIKIAMVDDHLVFRQGIKKLLQGLEDMEIVMDAASGEELLDKLKAAANMPDVLFLDIEMGGMNGFELMGVLGESWPQIKVIGLSAYENEFSMIRLFRLGAMGYLQKGCSIVEIRKAVSTVHQGSFYYDDPACRHLIYRIQKGYRYPDISDRELEFLNYCCSEMKYKEIAAAMRVSERTVEGYRESLCRKLELESRAGLVMFAMSTGIVSEKKVHKQ